MCRCFAGTYLRRRGLFASGETMTTRVVHEYLNLTVERVGKTIVVTGLLPSGAKEDILLTEEMASKLYQRLMWEVRKNSG